MGHMGESWAMEHHIVASVLIRFGPQLYMRFDAGFGSKVRGIFLGGDWRVLFPANFLA